MVLRNFLILILLITVLTGCSTNHTNEQSQLDQYEVSNTVAEIKKGDFIYRLVTEKKVYQNNDSINLYAELEYVGDKDKIKIYHGATPIYFPMSEKTRGYQIPYNTTDPLRTTILKKGEPLIKEYGGSGSYSQEDKEAYIDFMKSVMDHTLPKGYYVVDGYVDFYVIEENEEEKDYRINAQVDFKVK
ncbi:hypothetical protein [Pontibacillus marinus]|uniref:Uncharacterized protein n=1 Tax=Pontibacillus marinus BH030004 = DSM 16465 TaxID=1385511 RepID=A0A0A5FYD8_9BACI|nr:hypothetical protein [Pontibacillus marinus]KGX83820.1 hypothetical protein N783_21395 [Pontibacillus marinus BH030004 = DSM 16465]